MPRRVDSFAGIFRHVLGEQGYMDPGAVGDGNLPVHAQSGLAHCDPPLRPARTHKRKTDAAEHVHVFNHVGLLVTGPPAKVGLPFN
jgi:hypothetical protein